MNNYYLRYAKIPTLDKLVEQGWLRKTISPCGKLVQYNYTKTTQYEKHWNKHTINNRGHIYEIETGRLVARSFPKFFNYSELTPTKQRHIVKQKVFDVYEKLDGCLGIIYNYDGEWRINSRGSFDSFASKAGKEILSTLDMNSMIAQDHLTFLVEIIHPNTKIILNYNGKKELCLIGGYYGSGAYGELDDNVLDEIAEQVGFTRPRRYNYTFDELFELQETIGKNQEGFVVKLLDNTRVKFKGEEYLKIAKILSHMTYKNFWRSMRGKQFDRKILQEIPEELQNEAKSICFDLETNYLMVSNEIRNDYHTLMDEISDHNNWCKKTNPLLNKFGNELTVEDCKIIGLALQSYCTTLKHKDIIFPFIKQQDIHKYIHKCIEPKGE